MIIRKIRRNRKKTRISRKLELPLERVDLTDDPRGRVEAVDDLRLGDLLGAALDHDDRVVRSGE